MLSLHLIASNTASVVTHIVRCIVITMVISTVYIWLTSRIIIA